MARITETERTALADELLAVRCQLGEPAAFDALVERWHPSLQRYVRRLVDDDERAADVLQDAWLRILRALPGLRDPARLRPWLFGITRRAVMDRLRRQYAEPAGDGPESADLAAPEPDIELIDDIDAMHAELATLPLAEREVLVLYYLRELPLAQVAEVLAVPAGTVKSRLFRARKLLRDRLERTGSRDD